MVKSIPITLDKPRQMRLSFRAIRALTEKHGTLGKIFTALDSASDLDEFSTETVDIFIDFLHKLLLDDDPDLTTDHLMSILDIGAVYDIKAAIQAVFLGHGRNVEDGEDGAGGADPQ